MKKLLLLITLFGIIFLAILCKPANHDSKALKPPVDGIIIKEGSEDFPKRKQREAWFERMHQAAEGVDWRAIEIENRKEQAEKKHMLRKTYGFKRNGSEIVADGRLKGKWLERGSNNNAGNMEIVNYLVEDDMLYGRSAGGTLWKGDRTGFNWQVINQDYRFAGDLVEARYLENGTLRIIANLNHVPVYSDDGGITWTTGEGITGNGGAHMKDFEELSNGDMFVLQKSFGNGNYGLYRSQDNGENWQAISVFLTSDSRNLNLARVHNTELLMVIEQVNTDLSNVYMWNETIEAMARIVSNSQIGFGGNDRANLNATFAEDSLYMYVRNHEDKLFVSTDTAKTWRWKANLPTSPWAVGVYLSPSDHTKLMYGEVNPYRSANGGKFWNKVSDWSEYYNDIYTKLHADIMDIKEFKQADGTPFTVVCNHGGVSQSFDYGDTFENIGLFTLNIGQYYSVATHPENREWVFAGSQDQGLQRGKVNGEDESSLEQVISGDYGHITFSGEDHNMWAVYPWSSISYYDNPLIQAPTAWWSLPREQSNASAWIPQVIPHPDKSRNSIFLAGGSMNEDNGSYLIRLDVDQFNQIEATQYDHNFRQLGGDISAIGINHFDHDQIYILTANGIAFKSNNGGISFDRKEFGYPGGHWLYGSCIRPSKLDPNVVYISGSGYSNPGVYKSTDAGETYEPMDNGLPNTMVFSIAPNEDESLIFAATEAGPFVYVQEEDQWFDLSGVGTPNQTYWSVEYIEESKTARFGTYGRGIWDFDVEEQLVSVEEEWNSSKTTFKAYPNPFVNQITLDSDYDDPANVIVTDLQGRLIQQINDQKVKNLSLDLSDLNNGIYFVTVKMKNRSVTEKIVKN